MSMASTTPWQFTIGPLTIKWAAAAGLAGLDQGLEGAEAPRDRALDPALPVEAIAAQLAEGAQVLLDAPPHRVAARTTPPTQGADWRARVYVWMSELGG